MHVNDLIFRELIKRGYSLEGKTRVWNIADSKLWYLTPEQAQSYLDLVSTEEYKKGIGPKELSLIEENKEDILKRVGRKPFNLVDLGCGNGKKALTFINTAVKNSKLRYCPIDISSYMVEHAIKEVLKLKTAPEIVKVHWNISDFENLQNVIPLLRKDEFKRNFFLLLGNTLGNFEIHELLNEVRSSMREGDALLIGNGLNNNNVNEDIVKACRNNPAFDDFFMHILSQIGFEKKNVQYDVRFENSRIEFFYTVKRDTYLDYHSKKVEFKSGDQIIVAYTYHYEEDEFTTYLQMYFSEAHLFKSEDGSYCLALCKK